MVRLNSAALLLIPSLALAQITPPPYISGSGVARGAIVAPGYLSNAIVTPSQPTLSATTGTILAGTYYYRIEAIVPRVANDANNRAATAACNRNLGSICPWSDWNGSAWVVKTYSATAAGPSRSITLASAGGVTAAWAATIGATGYRIFRGTGDPAFGGGFMAQVGAVTTWTDDGSITPAVQGWQDLQNTTSLSLLDGQWHFGPRPDYTCDPSSVYQCSFEPTVEIVDAGGGGLRIQKNKTSNTSPPVMTNPVLSIEDTPGDTQPYGTLFSVTGSNWGGGGRHPFFRVTQQGGVYVSDYFSNCPPYSGVPDCSWPSPGVMISSSSDLSAGGTVFGAAAVAGLADFFTAKQGNQSNGTIVSQITNWGRGYFAGSVTPGDGTLGVCDGARATAGHYGEGDMRFVSGATTTPTKWCGCTYMPTGAVWAWINITSGTAGNTTTCP